MKQPTMTFSTTVQVAGGDVDLKGSGQSEPGDFMGAQAGDVLPVENDAARHGREHAGDAVEEGGLAGAVRPDEPQQFALLD